MATTRTTIRTGFDGEVVASNEYYTVVFDREAQQDFVRRASQNAKAVLFIGGPRHMESTEFTYHPLTIRVPSPLPAAEYFGPNLRAPNGLRFEDDVYHRTSQVAVDPQGRMAVIYEHDALRKNANVKRRAKELEETVIPQRRAALDAAIDKAAAAAGAEDSARRALVAADLERQQLQYDHGV